MGGVKLQAGWIQRSTRHRPMTGEIYWSVVGDIHPLLSSCQTSVGQLWWWATPCCLSMCWLIFPHRFKEPLSALVTCSKPPRASFVSFLRNRSSLLHCATYSGGMPPHTSANHISLQHPRLSPVCDNCLLVRPWAWELTPYQGHSVTCRAVLWFTGLYIRGHISWRNSNCWR